MFQKPIIIEFYGLPGSGKTAVSKALQQKLEKVGASTMCYYQRCGFYRNAYSLLFAPNYWKKIAVVSAYASLLPGRHNALRILSMINYFRMYRHFITDKPKDILLVDQGIIQSIISLAHTDILPDLNHLNKIFEGEYLSGHQCFIVNCNLRKETAFDRIGTRPMNGCRMEKMTESDRMQALDAQAANIIYLRSFLKRVFPSTCLIDVNTEEPVEDSVNKIFSHITDFN